MKARKKRGEKIKEVYICLQKKGYNPPSVDFHLLAPPHGFVTHVDQPSLGLTVREVADGLNGLIGVVLSQTTCLLHTVTAVDDLTGLVVHN
jgi:hypothetical protein